MEGASIARPAPAEAGVGPVPPVTLSYEQRTTARRCLTFLGVLWGLGTLGTASSLYLATHLPLLLIALSPIGRHMLLVAPVVDPLAFLAVGVSRKLLSRLVFYRLGQALGPAGTAWLEERSTLAGRFVRWLERVFGRAPRAAVFLLPGVAVAMIAGSAGMRARVLVPLLTAALSLRLVAILLLGEALREPIEAILALLDEYWIPGTVLIVAGIAAQQAWLRRRRPAAPAS